MPPVKVELLRLDTHLLNLEVLRMPKARKRKRMKKRNLRQKEYALD
jgi:hypothetical protein